MSYLVFSTALPDNKNSTIRAAMQDVMLYIASLGMPVMRFHADRGEFFSANFRAWLRNQGVRATWSEPGEPQSNGVAERTVRWIKDRARALLRGGGLPLELWPTAIESAAAEQRAKTLGWKSKLIAPYGSRVHMKKRPFTAKGPRRKAEALESKWTSGHYVGLSGLIDDGHLVYIPPGDGGPDDKGGFLHTLHVRPHLHDPGVPEQELEAEEPHPSSRRRVIGKKPPVVRTLSIQDPTPGDIADHARQQATRLLEHWDVKEAKDLVGELALLGFFDSRKFGMYRHGGVVGMMKGQQEFPEVTQVLARILREADPAATFTAMWVSRNVEKELHQDQNNAEASYNFAVPIVCPSRGGELWVELSRGDVVKGAVTTVKDNEGRELFGQVLPLRPDLCNTFSPRRKHQVLPWTGERVVLIGYTPECLGKMTYSDIEQLEELGFVVPIFQFPEANEPVEPKMQSMEPNLHVLSGDDGDCFLELPEGRVCIDGLLTSRETRPPMVQKIEVNYTRNIEEVLASLTGPLEVTYTAHPSEVLANLQVWEPAIRKEVKSVSVAIQRLMVGTPEREHWFRKPGVQRLPTKFVFTVKPRDDAVASDPTTWFKRKARLVVCGNMATNECESVYTEAAPAEAVRAALALTVRNSWAVGIIDIVTAFLKTPIGEAKSDPVILVSPPKLLEKLGITSAWELWALTRALYGLKEAPKLWGAHRDKQLAKVTVTIADAIWSLQQGRAITSWWTVRDDHQQVQGIVLIYVDDFLLCGAEHVIRELTREIQKLWDTSDLRLLQRDVDLRFLGMELHYEDDNSLSLSQEGYVQELLRSHGVENVHTARVPVAKEQAVFMTRDEDEQGTPEQIRYAQQLTGEILWLSQRTRPDLAYLSSLMASLSCRAPRRAIQLGTRAHGYLVRTRSYRLSILFDDGQLAMYCDAAFAPEGGRSHEGWAVMWAGTPILWRSGRQSLVSLSTGESELIAILNGTVGMLGVEALLQDIDITVTKREVRSDSTAALAIASGGSSWRTRHLRIKANWLFEQLQSGYVVTRHCAGKVQLADLLTKALTGQRIVDLLCLWGLQCPTRGSLQVPRSNIAAKILVATICCLLVLTTEARTPATATEEEAEKKGIQLDWDMIGWLLVFLAIIGGLVVWEGLKWVIVSATSRWIPGSSERRLRKLQRLRDATARAIEKELENLNGPLAEDSRQEDLDQRRPATQVRAEDSRQENVDQRRPATQVRAVSRSEQHRSSCRSETPSTPRRPSLIEPSRSPGAQSSMSRSTWRDDEVTGAERERVVKDLLHLATVEELRVGLRHENLTQRGIKHELVGRLANRLQELEDQVGEERPTVKQMKYVLWLWRERTLNYKVHLAWDDVRTKERISLAIDRWKHL